MKLSDQVREVVRSKYVRPALQAGKVQFSVAVKDVMRDLAAQGFPSGNTPQICTAPRKKSFLEEEGIEIESIDGPASKMSTTVVFHYKAADRSDRVSRGLAARPVVRSDETNEDPADRAKRLTEKLRGLLKDEMAEYGGGEAFIRWVRGYDEEDGQ